MDVRIDHIVFTVRDIPTTVDFYEKTLGMRHVSFNNRSALKFGNQKINLHQLEHEFEPKAAHATAGAMDICLITEVPIEKARKHLESCGVSIIESGIKTGAVGKINSIYFRDPDWNLVELSNYIN